MAIVASGPSVIKAEVAALKGAMTVLAIKRNVELAPWADAVYGCDQAWWRSVRGLPDFKGLKMAYAPRACDEYGLTRVEIPVIRADLGGDVILTGEIGVVGAGGCSGFQALNLAVQFGARRIALLGFDCQDRSGVHWYGRNTAQGMANPSMDNLRRWRAAFEAAVPTLEQLGVEVVNASRLSDIRGFRRASVAEVLQQWGLVCSAASS